MLPVRLCCFSRSPVLACEVCIVPRCLTSTMPRAFCVDGLRIAMKSPTVDPI